MGWRRAASRGELDGGVNDEDRAQLAAAVLPAMPDEEPEGLCEYELQRQRNIAANEEKLKELGIENNPLNLHIRGPATSGAAAAKKSKRKAAVEKRVFPRV